MNEALLIWGYLALGDVLGLLKGLSAIALFIYFIFFMVSGIVSSFGQEEGVRHEAEVRVFKRAASIWKPLVFSCITILCLWGIYPDKDDLKWIIGGALVWNSVQYASDIEGIEKLPKNTVNAMNHFLESIQEEKPNED